MTIMNSTTPASATTGISPSMPSLPGELLDAIIDAITFDDDERALDALRACMFVSRAFRLRAMFILVARLDFSAAYGRAHILKSLELFNLLRTTPELRALPRSVVLDLGEPGVLTARALDILPELSNLTELTLTALNTYDSPLPRWGRPLEVEHLILDSCSVDNKQLDELLASFPKLRKLELVQTHISASSGDEHGSVVVSVPLPFSTCALHLSVLDSASSIAVFEWAITHQESFTELSTLALAPSVIPSALRAGFLAVFGDSVTTLTLGLVEAQHAADENKATLEACKSVRTLNVLTPSLPQAVMLFRSVRLAPPPHVQRVVVSTDDGDEHRADDIKTMRDAMSGWPMLAHLRIDKTPLALMTSSAPVAGFDDVHPVDMFAPRSDLDFDPDLEAKDSTLDILLIGPAVDDERCDCDDETVGAPTPSLHAPEQYRCDSDTDSDTDESSAYEPPFELGVSIRHDDTDDESDLDSSSDDFGPDTPHDSDVDLPEVSGVKRDPYAPPFDLGVAIAHPRTVTVYSQEHVDLNFPEPYKAPFALGQGMENGALVE